MISLEEAENELYGIYQWFAKESPGTVVQETGHVADLWAIVDRYLEPE